MAAMLRAVYAQFAMEGAVDADAFDAMTRHMGTAFASRAALLAALKAFGRPIHNPRSRGGDIWILNEADFVRVSFIFIFSFIV